MIKKLINHYKNISDSALKNLSEGKEYKFVVDEKILNENISSFKEIDNSKASKELIDNYEKDMRKMIKTANFEYKKVLNKLKTTDDEILKQKILADYADTGVIGFHASDGARWNIETYSNMYTRHVNNECVRNSVIEESKNQGKDSVKISKHGTKCHLCIPWEGKILTFEELEEAKNAGLFHPNCLHVILFVVGRLRF